MADWAVLRALVAGPFARVRVCLVAWVDARLAVLVALPACFLAVVAVPLAWARVVLAWLAVR